jgi:hypothetical protein
MVGETFVRWYNSEHHHCGIAWFCPEEVIAV